MLYIIYEYFSPAYKAGGPIQSLSNLVDQLQGEISTRVICRNRDLDGHALNVPVDRWTDHNQAKVFYCSRGFAQFRSAIEKDKPVFFINGLYSLQYSFLPLFFLKGRKVVSVRGMLHPEALGQKPFKKKIYLAAWKLLGGHRRCEFHATSGIEKKYILEKFGSEVKVWVITNLPKLLPYQKLPYKKMNELILVTLALISPMKNHLLVLEALATVQHQVSYHIFGPVKDSVYWSRCQSVIARLPSNISVIYHGSIPPKMTSEVLGKAHVYIQPSESENFGHSIYEALAGGRPVITSLTTPWNDLESASAGLNVTAAIKPLAEAILFFSRMQQEDLNNWSRAARDYALKAVNISQIKQDYLRMFTADSANGEV